MALVNMVVGAYLASLVARIYAQLSGAGTPEVFALTALEPSGAAGNIHRSSDDRACASALDRPLSICRGSRRKMAGPHAPPRSTSNWRRKQGGR